MEPMKKESSNDIANKKAELKKSLKKNRDRDREIVRGIFRFHEVPGGSMKFCFRAYKEDPIETFEMVDGEVYKIPLGVARHLNKNCWYPKYAFEVDGQGKPVRNITKKVRRCSFQSLDFMDAEQLSEIGDPCMPDLVVTAN